MEKKDSVDAELALFEHPPARILEPLDITALELLQAVYRDPNLPLSVRLRVAREAIPYEQPRLSMVANAGPGFASALEEAVKRRQDYIANYRTKPALPRS
jgi:hypothetical protein